MKNLKIVALVFSAVMLFSACKSKEIQIDPDTVSEVAEKMSDCNIYIFEDSEESVTSVMDMNSALELLRSKNAEAEKEFDDKGVAFAYGYYGKAFIVDEDLYYFSFGTDDEEHFSNERSFAVSLETGTVYEYDVVTDDFIVIE